MDLDDVKKTWQEEKISHLPEISLETKSRLALPLDRIRQNMKFEFWFSIGMLPMLILLYIPIVKSQAQALLFLILFLLNFVVLIYYYVKFIALYKNLQNNSFSTYHSLLNLRYELVLNTELYKSYYISSIPMFFGMLLILFFEKINYTAIFSIFIVLAVLSLIILCIGKLWLREMYGKYIVQMSYLVDELSEEPSDFNFNKNSIYSNLKFSFLVRTETYFESKFGKKGRLIHQIFWSVVILLFIVICSYCLGYAVAKIMLKLDAY